MSCRTDLQSTTVSESRNFFASRFEMTDKPCWRYIASILTEYTSLTSLSKSPTVAFSVIHCSDATTQSLAALTSNTSKVLSTMGSNNHAAGPSLIVFMRCPTSPGSVLGGDPESIQDVVFSAIMRPMAKFRNCTNVSRYLLSHVLGSSLVSPCLKSDWYVWLTKSQNLDFPILSEPLVRLNFNV